MLTILGRKQRHCDGISRRNFLKIGALGIGAGALTLADVFRAEAGAGTRSPHKAVINIWLNGGPPHHDMWDMKPDAPAEIRGEFKPIATNVPGLRIGETFPKIAAVMDKCAVIRSVVGSVGQHDAYQCMTGWPGNFVAGAPIASSGRPNLGSVAAKLLGPVDPSVPPYVMLEGPNKIPAADLRKNAFKAGFLGSAFAPFEPDGPGMANLKLNGITLEQLADRRRLLASFDCLRQEIDVTGTMKGMDALTEAAMGVLTSSRLLEALDISKEPSKVRERYGSTRFHQYTRERFAAANEQFLVARRLIEAGVRCITMSWGSWDSHQNNFNHIRGLGPQFDQGFSALVEDLHQRGLSRDVTVIAWGEFGRTPRINKDAGRDHWPYVSCALLSGGGMPMGQAIGATNRLGEHVQERPVHFQEVFATLYHNLGINPASTTIKDPSGRPQYLVEHPVIRELL
jgi:hypothetical protein